MRYNLHLYSISAVIEMIARFKFIGTSAKEVSPRPVARLTAYALRETHFASC